MSITVRLNKLGIFLSHTNSKLVRTTYDTISLVRRMHKWNTRNVIYWTDTLTACDTVVGVVSRHGLGRAGPPGCLAFARWAGRLVRCPGGPPRQKSQ